MAALDKVKNILGFTDTEHDSELSVYLELAEQELLVWTYGKNSSFTALPSWLEPIQVMAVVTAYNQRGAEGETYETVDGVTHNFKHDTMVGYIHNNAPSYAEML